MVSDVNQANGKTLTDNVHGNVRANKQIQKNKYSWR